MIDNSVTSKNSLFLRDIISVYHPKFQQNRSLRRCALESPYMFNVENLIEECLAAQGGYNFVDEHYRDFDDVDNSDSKSVTLIKDGHAKSAIISNIEGKIGSLRVTIYNPYRNRIDFMYIPKKQVALLKEPCYGKNRFKEKLRARYNEPNDHYNRFEPFRLPSFLDLAKACD